MNNNSQTIFLYTALIIGSLMVFGIDTFKHVVLVVFGVFVAFITIYNLFINKN